MKWEFGLCCGRQSFLAVMDPGPSKPPGSPGPWGHSLPGHPHGSLCCRGPDGRTFGEENKDQSSIQESSGLNSSPPLVAFAFASLWSSPQKSKDPRLFVVFVVYGMKL